MQEMWVQSLGQEDPLEKEIAIHSGILAWEIPWTGESGRLQSVELQELDMTQRLNNQPANQGMMKNSWSLPHRQETPFG